MKCRWTCTNVFSVTPVVILVIFLVILIIAEMSITLRTALGGWVCSQQIKTKFTCLGPCPRWIFCASKLRHCSLVQEKYTELNMFVTYKHLLTDWAYPKSVTIYWFTDVLWYIICSGSILISAKHKFIQLSN
jgi:hypothetical protein